MTINIETLRFDIQLNKLDNSQMVLSPLVVGELLDRLEAWENVFGHLGTPDEVGNEWHALNDRLEAAEKHTVELEERCAVTIGALRLAVRQNSHDMLMTAEELRSCEAVLEKWSMNSIVARCEPGCGLKGRN